jgi:hypothetical protein
MKLGFVLAIAVLGAMAQTPRPDNAQSLVYVEAAKKLAGTSGSDQSTPGRRAASLLVGTDRYVRFWTIVSECMQAEIARR